MGPDQFERFKELLVSLESDGITELTRGELALKLSEKMSELHPERRLSHAFHVVDRFAHRARRWSWGVNRKHQRVFRRREVS